MSVRKQSMADRGTAQGRGPKNSAARLPGALRPRGLACLWGRRDGVTAIEMAFVLPVFILFLLGITEFGRALWTQTTLQYAVETAARCAKVTNGALCLPTVEAYAASQAIGMTIPPSAFTYTPNATCGVGSDDTGAGGAEVSVSFPFVGLVPQLIPVDVTLSARSCHP
jgi:hypothetical protein